MDFIKKMSQSKSYEQNFGINPRYLVKIFTLSHHDVSLRYPNNFIHLFFSFCINNFVVENKEQTKLTIIKTYKEQHKLHTN